ncbi:NXPE family member 4-like [Anolis sagrei]|uniref:NXPE family member 4-like n=1 Tax=Anolis sagrei TaxID=38937 RepID=UPI0035204CC4
MTQTIKRPKFAHICSILIYLSIIQNIFFNLSIQDGRSNIFPSGDAPLSQAQAQIEREVQELVAKLDRRFPRVPLPNLGAVSNAHPSWARLYNPKAAYCLGEQLMVRLDMFDQSRQRKTHGGDFLRARIFSPYLRAGASGNIQDFGNGTYLIRFPLLWEGEVRVSILLFHPSEGVSALWVARKRGYDRITFTGFFLNGTARVSTKCSMERIPKEELCEYLDRRDQEAFYCLKPKNISCQAFVGLKSSHTKVSHLTYLERSILHSSNIGVETSKRFGSIRVLPCQSKERTPKDNKCPLGMNSPSPSGFFWQNYWHSVLCTVPVYSHMDYMMNTCLRGKHIYLMGDSTVRQWLEHLTKKVHRFQYLDTHGVGNHQNMMAVDLDANIHIRWIKHNHPFLSGQEYTTKGHSYVTREIDRIAGDARTVLVLAFGQHFRPFPIQIFIRRMINIREAVQRLLLRSPETKVVIKGENTRELDIDVERLGDFHGFAQNLVLRDIFKGLRVAFIDAWDMTIAYGSNQVHPGGDVVWSQIRLFFNYIC